MALPFTYEEFINVFKSYNLAVFPAQIIAYALGLFSLVIFLFRKTQARIINIILGGFWSFTGIFYHFLYFSEINRAAFLFGILFIAQGIIFFYQAFENRRLKYHLDLSKFDIMQFFAIIFFLYSLVIYPLLSQAFGHYYPYAPSFGITPCPTVIFTIAFLLLSENKLFLGFWIIPFLWAFIGFFAATQLGMIEDYGLLISALIAVFLILRKNRLPKRKTEIVKNLVNFFRQQSKV